MAERLEQVSPPSTRLPWPEPLSPTHNTLHLTNPAGYGRASRASLLLCSHITQQPLIPTTTNPNPNANPLQWPYSTNPSPRTPQPQMIASPHNPNSLPNNFQSHSQPSDCAVGARCCALGNLRSRLSALCPDNLWHVCGPLPLWPKALWQNDHGIWRWAF